MGASKSSSVAEVAASPFLLGHRPALDGLRGLAVLAVLLFHAVYHLPGGFLGVDVFFVLSGFLITALLLQEWQRTGTIDLRQFYLRRAVRLLPALYLLLLVGALYTGWYTQKYHTPYEMKAYSRDARSAFLYTYNWDLVLRTRLHSPLLVHTWSLAVEEQFYLVWPLLLLGLLWLRARRRWIVLAVLAGITFAATRRALLWDGPTRYHRLYYCTDTRADALLVGCLVGLFASWDLLPKGRLGRFLLQLASLGAVGVLGWYMSTADVTEESLYRVGFLVVALATAVLLASLLCAPFRPLAWLMERPVLTWLGRISYGLYLWHYFTMRVLEHYLWRHWNSVPRRVLLPFLVALAAAVVSHYGLERPILRLKSRLRPRTPATPEPILDRIDRAA